MCATQPAGRLRGLLLLALGGVFCGEANLSRAEPPQQIRQGNPAAAQAIPRTTRPDSSEDATAGFPAADPMSRRHHELRLRLQRTTALPPADATLDDALALVSKGLGVPLRLAASLDTPQARKQRFAWQSTQPATYAQVADIIAQRLGQYGGVLEFTAEAVVVTPNTEAGAGYRVYDLSQISDYTTARRREIIAEIRREIAADTWASADVWIRPGVSVFQLEVYQTPQIHQRISERIIKSGPYPPAVTVLLPDPSALKNSSELVLSREKLVKQLRQQYAFESMEQRLAYEGRAANRGGEEVLLSEASRQRLQQRDTASPWEMTRSLSLKKLHEGEVADFIGREGFGISRLPSPGPSYLPLPAPPEIPLAADISLPSSSSSERAFQATIPATDTQAATGVGRMPSQPSLLAFHELGQSFFAPFNSFGYIKGRGEVAGFRPHAFSALPRLAPHAGNLPVEHWALHKLELVSLLKHEKPRVYVSSKLPRMEDLPRVPTREPRPFENHGLRELLAGEDVVTRATLNRIEMLGAVRASKQCLQCHQVPHGRLLGAFSYVLLRDPQLNADQLRAAERPQG